MFATLFSSSPAGLIATHLPFVFDETIAQLEQQGDGALAAWIRRYNDLPEL